MTIKLVAVDMDGTLLTEDKKITERTRRAVRAATEQGLSVALSTGRTLPECADVRAFLPEVRYAVTSNGARVWDMWENRVLTEHCLTPECSRTLAERLIGFKGMLAAFSGGKISIQKEWEGQLSQVLVPVMVAHAERFYTPEPRYMEYAAGLHGAVEKFFCVFVSTQERDRAWDAIRDVDCEIVTSDVDNLELTAAGVNKGTGLSGLAAALGLSREEVMAIGDSGNDRTMLQYAGLPAAMGNAEPSIKALAKTVLPSNEEDGVAWALERLAEHAGRWN